MDDLIADLERLARLREAGALTQVEYDSQKARLLGTSAAPAQCSGCGAPLQLGADGRCIYCHEQQVATGGGDGGSSSALDDDIARAHPNNKIEAIKALRQQTGLGLRLAKERIDAAYRRLGL